MTFSRRFGRLLQVDLTSRSVEEFSIPPGEVRRFLGGKGLGIRLLEELLPPGTDPLAPENLLLFLNGPFTGTPFPTSGRFAVITKSPLTGLFTDSHAGGFFGPELAKAGWDGIVVRGASSEPCYLWIDDDRVEIRDGAFLKDLPVSAKVEAVRGVTSEKAHVASIGPAGERRVRIATITVDRDGDPWRSGIAARGGPGAVMGSKGLLAVAVRGTGNAPLADTEKMRALAVRMNAAMRENSMIHIRRTVGTSFWVDSMNRAGMLPTRNFQKASLPFHYGLTAPNLRYYTKRDVACFNCTIACGKVARFGDVEAKVEFESIALLGSNDGMKDVAEVGRAVHCCNELGLDTISAGAVVSFAMECGEKGLLSGVPAFGDGAGQLRLLEDLAYRRGAGELLADGVRLASEKIGGGSESWAMHVKGMEIPGYEPRGAWGMALAYATSDRGACHQRAWTSRAEIDGELPRFSRDAFPRFVKDVQDERAAAYSLVVCDFLPMTTEDLEEGLAAALGEPFSYEEYLRVGERIWNCIRRFNHREGGISRRDDTLPPRILEEALELPPGLERRSVRLTREDLEAMLNAYYALRGWDDSGLPTAETLCALGVLS